MNTLKTLISYVRQLRLRHLKKAIAAGFAAAGLVLGKDLIAQSHIDASGLVALGLGTAVLTFFAPSNAATDPVVTDVDPAPEQD